MNQPAPEGLNAQVLAWSEADLGVEGRVLDVVRAPAAVLSTVGGVVDPTGAESVQLAADLVATIRVSPGVRRTRGAAGGRRGPDVLRRRLRAPQDP